MKVCFLTHNLKQDNGAGVFSLRLILGLKKELGIESIILTTEASGYAEEKAILPVNQRKFIWQFFRIRKIIKGCDVIHALDGYPYGVVAYLASFGLGKKLIITAVGSGAIIQLYKPFYSWFLKRAYRVADKVTAVSNFTKNEIIKHIRNLAVDVITHGVDGEKFTGSNFANENFPRPYILSVGSLRWRKGYHRSIEAFASVVKKFPDLNYVIIGKKYDQAYCDRIHKLIKDLRLENRIFIFDNINSDDALRAAYKNAEVFCLMPQTAHHDLEGFGLVFLEAAAAGLPVVGTFGSGVEDAVLDGKNGFLVDARDNIGFAESIAKILESADLKSQMALASLEFARASNWEGKIKCYAEVYKKSIAPKIVYVTNARLPTEKAHGLATVKIAEAFADLGYSVELIHPKRWFQKKEDIFNHYSLRRNFKIIELFTVDPLSNRIAKWVEKPAFWLQLFSFSIIATIYSTWRSDRQVVFFSHDHIPLYFLSFFSSKIFYDIHHFPENTFLYKRVLGKSFGLAVQTKWKIKALEENFGVKPEKIIYWPNGTEVEKFKIQKSKLKIREELGLPQDKRIVLYTGQLFDWKGVDVLIGAAALLPDTNFYVVGGLAEDILRFSKAVKNVSENFHFTGQRPHSEISLWLSAADVLVLPNTGKQKVSLYYTSPMKMFEYMASGTPIVASLIPSISEILNEKNAFLAEADNPKSFSKKITCALEHPEEAKEIGLQAQRDVQKYTWKERATRIAEDAFKKI